MIRKKAKSLSSFFPVAGTAVLAGAALLSACSQQAPQQNAGTGPAPAYTPPFTTDITLSDIMEGIVMPGADSLWMAVQVDVTADGEKYTVPGTDAAWLSLRHEAIKLAAVTNLLMIPDLKISRKPDTEHGEGELSPAEMAKLRAADLPGFAAHAKNLHDVALKAIEAIDKRDAEALSNVGGDMDAVCEACHKQFWYPNG